MKMSVALLLILSMTTGLAGAESGGGSAVVVHWACASPLLPDFRAGASSSQDVGEGVTYVYVGDEHLDLDYGADAKFTTMLDRRRGWYDSAVRLGPLKENNGFAQVEISRWERFRYRQHVAIAWALPHTNIVEYRDTGLILADGVPHRLGIYVRDGLLELVVDGRVVCSTQASYFVGSSERKYFQVRTETSVVGSNGNARVSDLRLKRDADAGARPYRTDCVLHRHGIFWTYLGAGRFAARGAFYPQEATYFTGIDPSKSCHT
jgi:hypothetical protein